MHALTSRPHTSMSLKAFTEPLNRWCTLSRNYATQQLQEDVTTASSVSPVCLQLQPMISSVVKGVTGWHEGHKRGIGDSKHLAADGVGAMAVQRDVRDGPPLGSALDVRRRHPAPVVIAVRMEVDANQLARLGMRPVNKERVQQGHRISQ